jgi:hypothetical protein
VKDEMPDFMRDPQALLARFRDRPLYRNHATTTLAQKTPIAPHQVDLPHN